MPVQSESNKNNSTTQSLCTPKYVLIEGENLKSNVVVRGRRWVPLVPSGMRSSSGAHPVAQYSRFLCERLFMGSVSLCFDRSLFVS